MDVISKLKKEDKRLLSDAFQYPMIDLGQDNFWLRAKRIDFTREIMEHLAEIRRDGFERKISELDDSSLMLIWRGIMSTGDIPKRYARAMKREELLCFYAGRGADCYQDLPQDVEIFPDKELYGYSMGCIKSGRKYIARWQPKLGWEDHGTTQTIYFDGNLNLGTAAG
jgi:hypothetical protein